jgi:outer membrane protein TolC
MKSRPVPVSKTLAHATLAAALALALNQAAWAQSPPEAEPSAVAAGTPSTAAAMSLKQLVERVLQSNRTIRSKRAERDIAATGIERASAAFQPQASVSAMRGMSRQKNTHEEELIRQSLGIYERESNDYAVGVSQLLSSGAKVELKASLASFLTNNNDPLRPPGTNDNRSGLSLSIMQPLARDAGRAVTEARGELARLDTLVAEHASRDTETSVVAEAIIAYYDLVLAQQRVVAAQEKIRSGERLLSEAKAMFRQGRLPEADVWEVENALARFQSAVSEARQGERERINRLRTQLMAVAADTAGAISATDPLPEVSEREIRPEDSLAVALQRREDFLMRKVQVEREGIQLAYAQNQALPRIDLVASYGVNGLDYSKRQAIRMSQMNDYPTWNLGLQVSVPLGENRQAKADIAAADLRREDALLGVKAMEVQIANDIDTTLGLRASVAQRWALWKQIQGREVQQLELERRKFAAGRSDTREVLLREERVINARVAEQEQQMAFGRAEVLLLAAQGTLLDGFR